MVVPDCVDRDLLGEFCPFRLTLPPVIMKKLHLRGLGIVDVDVVTEQEEGPRIDRSYCIPHPLVRGDVSGSSAEGDGELV